MHWSNSLHTCVFFLNCSHLTTCSSSLYFIWDALMWSCFERVRERRRGPAETLTLFSNDWFNMVVCVDLFTHITYLLYWIMFAGISFILNMKAAGMSKTMWYTHNPPWNSGHDYNTVTEICEIKLHNVFVFFLPGLEIAVSKCHGFFRIFIYEL